MKYIIILFCLVGVLVGCSDNDGVTVYYEYRVVELENGRLALQYKINNLEGSKDWIGKKWATHSARFKTEEEACEFMELSEIFDGKSSVEIKRVVDCNKEGE